MVTHHLQVERRTAKERWQETDVLPLSHTDQLLQSITIVMTRSIQIQNTHKTEKTQIQCTSMLRYAVRKVESLLEAIEAIKSKIYK